MGLKDIFYSLDIDYMLEIILLVNYLLFITYYLRNNLDQKRNYFLLNSQKNNSTISNKDIGIQSAENYKGFSETIRQLLKFKKNTKNNEPSDIKFFSWLAGIIDGGGNFKIKKDIFGNLLFISLEIKVHNRDLRILTRIQNKLHTGQIKIQKKKSCLIISDKIAIYSLINNLNGLIRIKLNTFKKVCLLNNIVILEPNYIIPANDPYFGGLVDIIGSIHFNFTCNRIECSLKFKYDISTSKLCLDFVVPYYKPSKVYGLNSLNLYKDINFKFKTVKGMIYLYNYFMENRLYSDYKFYRVSKIKDFIMIRNYKYSDYNSIEYILYSKFLLNWIQYKNPLWNKVFFIRKLNKDIVLNLQSSVFNLEFLLTTICIKFLIPLFILTINKLIRVVYNCLVFNNKYFLLFILDLFKYKNPSWKVKIDYALDQLILYVFKDIQKLNPFVFIIFSIFIYYNSISYNYLIDLLCVILLNISAFIMLIRITKFYIFNLKYIDKLDNKTFNYFLIKYMFFVLILLTACLLIILLNKFVNKLTDILINRVVNYILNIKNFNSGNSWNLKKLFFQDNKQPPKGSRDFFFDSGSTKKKKTHKDITKKALEMKDKVINIQNEKLLNTNGIIIENKQFYGNRKWDKTIFIEERPQLSIPQQLDRVKIEYEAYDNQEKKFKFTINNINSNKENFYPKESISLFKEYIQIIKGLKINLKSMETNLKKRKK
uniref:LAGLIDADG endonuclease n=1 Tax=Stachybotrys chlorohalonatus TaxID=388913 RepID=UPI001EDF7906|nr:LAGLIDADG endonuclease [Stachybotrys chlorohalonata]UIX25743.1 LAGLIDADG endonuclease [Stachybotrys chlorohalonata]